MTRDVQLFSGVDQIGQRVQYWTKFNGARSERLTEYRTVLERAEALVAEHRVGLIDRSDKGSGLLRSTLDQ